MLDNLLSRVFSDRKKSSKIATDRLKFVLVHDRANVSSEFYQNIKSEIILVIKKYIDIDENDMEIKVEMVQAEDGSRPVPALCANIPIKNVRTSGK